MADRVRWLVEPGIPVVLDAACPAPQRHMAHAPATLGGFPGRVADTRQPRDFLRHTGSKRMPVQTGSDLRANSGAGIRWSCPELQALIGSSCWRPLDS